MIGQLKPFDGAEMRNLLDLLNEQAQPLDIGGTEYRQGGVKQLGIQPSQQDIQGREQAAGTLQTIDTLRKDAGKQTYSHTDPKVHSMVGGMKQDVQNLDKKLAVAGVGREAPAAQPQAPNVNKFKDLEDLEEEESINKSIDTIVKNAMKSVVRSMKKN